MKEAMAISPGIANPLLNVTEVINNYSKKLLGFIRKRVQTEADAEDILQDVFYQFIGNTKPIEQLSGWLFTVARNKITDRKRKKKPEALESILHAEQSDGKFDWSEVFTDNLDTPETSYLRNLFWEELTAALRELPAEQRDAFIQHELEGRSFKSIALETGETVNTLLSRKRYAVLHLRERLRILRDELINF
jgi:RNA polymerase sigma factor (sigma-70 family)